MGEFGETLQRVMSEKTLTAADISKACNGVSQPYISKILAGRISDPTFSKAKEIVTACGLNLDEFRALYSEGNEPQDAMDAVSESLPDAVGVPVSAKCNSGGLMELDTGLRRKVGAWLLGRGNTKQKLAAYLGITTQTLNNRLGGSFDWQWREIQLLADLFECSTDDLR